MTRDLIGSMSTARLTSRLERLGFVVSFKLETRRSAEGFIYTVHGSIGGQAHLIRKWNRSRRGALIECARIIFALQAE